MLFATLQFWWAFGSMFGALLAFIVMRPGGLGWHWYLGLAAIPLALVLLFFPVCFVGNIVYWSCGGHKYPCA